MGLPVKTHSNSVYEVQKYSLFAILDYFVLLQSYMNGSCVHIL